MDLESIALQVKNGLAPLSERLEKEGRFLRVSVMGCVVNGPGEAKDAELGLAGSKDGRVALFRRGVLFANLPQEEAFEALKREILAASTE